MSTPEITTILGQGSTFEGKLTFEGAVRIDGDFKGEIRTSGMLIVGETANVHAQIEGAQVVVHGQVRGDIVADELIELRAPAQVRGNVATPSLEIEKGARFDGSCKMAGEEPVMPEADDPVADDANAAASGED